MTHVSKKVRVALCDLLESLQVTTCELLWPMEDMGGISPDAERSAFQLRDRVNTLITVIQSNNEDIKTE